MKNEYADFLKHLGINKDLMLSDMQSRLPECEKPVLLKRCKAFESCESAKNHGCKGCPYSLDLQNQLYIMAVYFPEERKQCELIWGKVYNEYRRIGYRLENSLF